MNFGQRPFAFDIEGYFDKRHARARRVAASLLLEILEHVLQFAMLSGGANHLQRLSRVCRRWRTLFFRFVYELSISISIRSDLEGVLAHPREECPHFGCDNAEQLRFHSCEEGCLHNSVGFGH